jgi:hypothetical protein
MFAAATAMAASNAATTATKTAKVELRRQKKRLRIKKRAKRAAKKAAKVANAAAIVASTCMCIVAVEEAKRGKQEDPDRMLAVQVQEEERAQSTRQGRKKQPRQRHPSKSQNGRGGVASMQTQQQQQQRAVTSGTVLQSPPGVEHHSPGIEHHSPGVYRSVAPTNQEKGAEMGQYQRAGEAGDREEQKQEEEGCERGELLGKKVRKKFPGYGWFVGEVVSLSSSGYEVKWEDDSVTTLSEGSVRRFMERGGNSSSSSSSSGSGTAIYMRVLSSAR